MSAPIRFRGLERTEIIGRLVPVATTVASRLLGLALLDRDRVGEGLLIPSCSCIHTFGMQFALDVLFLDQEERLVELRRQVPPRRIAHNPVAAAVLELPSPLAGTGENSAASRLICPCSPRSKSSGRWWSARTTTRRASSSATT